MVEIIIKFSPKLKSKTYYFMEKKDKWVGFKIKEWLKWAIELYELLPQVNNLPLESKAPNWLNKAHILTMTLCFLLCFLDCLDEDWLRLVWSLNYSNLGLYRLKSKIMSLLLLILLLLLSLLVLLPLLSLLL